MPLLTRSRVSSETSPRPFITRETVAIETPASSAIWRIVSRGGATWAMLAIEACSGTFRNSTDPVSPQFAREGLDFLVADLVTVPETLSELLLLSARPGRERTADAPQFPHHSLGRTCRRRGMYRPRDGPDGGHPRSRRP